jgi:hypothetical protein
MFINIITPCSRPENLVKIGLSINIPLENFRWIVVFDAERIPELPVSELEFLNTEFYAHKNPEGCSGNPQRNFALDLVEEGYVYFQDDDTLMHPEFWESVKDLNNDFISFNQSFTDGKLRLKSGRTEVGYIDSHNFLLKKEIIGDTRWEMDKYEADGIFAEACAKKTRNLFFIDRTLSIYNALRP